MEENYKLKKENEELKGKGEEDNEKLKNDYNNLNNDYNKLKEENNDLKKQIENIKLENNKVKDKNKKRDVKQEDTKKEVPPSNKTKKVQIYESNKLEPEKSEKKDDNRNTNTLFKSMKVSSMAKQLESILNRPKSMVEPGKKDEAPITHETVDLAADNSETNKISYGGGSRRRKKAQKKFLDN